MKNSIEVLKKIYKPYKYTIKNSCTLLESTTGNIIIKEKGKTNIKELFSYLNSRNFSQFPKLIEDNRSDVNVFEYIDDIEMPIEQKMSDLISVVASLHNKTTYHKEVTDDKYKEIYENILANILYKEKVYEELVLVAEDAVFPSPSNQLLLNNSSKIFDALNFCKSELEEWYSLVLAHHKERVALIHNNLKLEHFIRNSKEYLISWDKAIIDTPILDIVNLYRNEALKVNFSEILKEYLDSYSLKDDELKLFFILIVIPDEVNLNNEELINVQNIRRLLDYIYKTEELIRPYYAKQKEE